MISVDAIYVHVGIESLTPIIYDTLKDHFVRIGRSASPCLCDGEDEVVVVGRRKDSVDLVASIVAASIERYSINVEFIDDHQLDSSSLVDEHDVRDEHQTYYVIWLVCNDGSGIDRADNIHDVRMMTILR